MLTAEVKIWPQQQQSWKQVMRVANPAQMQCNVNYI